MRHPIFRVQSFEIVGPYVLRVLFDDNKVQTINFRPILAGELYGPLPGCLSVQSSSHRPRSSNSSLAQWRRL